VKRLDRGGQGAKVLRKGAAGTAETSKVLRRHELAMGCSGWRGFAACNGRVLEIVLQTSSDLLVFLFC
jgi:hypothetical protein